MDLADELASKLDHRDTRSLIAAFELEHADFIEARRAVNGEGRIDSIVEYTVATRKSPPPGLSANERETFELMESLRLKRASLVIAIAKAHSHDRRYVLADWEHRNRDILNREAGISAVEREEHSLTLQARAREATEAALERAEARSRQSAAGSASSDESLRHERLDPREARMQLDLLAIGDARPEFRRQRLAEWERLSDEKDDFTRASARGLPKSTLKP